MLARGCQLASSLVTIVGVKGQTKTSPYRQAEHGRFNSFNLSYACRACNRDNTTTSRTRSSNGYCPSPLFYLRGQIPATSTTRIRAYQRGCAFTRPASRAFSSRLGQNSPKPTTGGDATLAGICIHIKPSLIGREQKRQRRLCATHTRRGALNKSPLLLLATATSRSIRGSVFQRGFGEKTSGRKN